MSAFVYSGTRQGYNSALCAVALAQNFGQNSHFPQQPRRAWLRAAQHAILGAQRFFPQARKNVAVFFVRRTKAKQHFEALFFRFTFLWRKNVRVPFLNSPNANFAIKALFIFIMLYEVEQNKVRF